MVTGRSRLLHAAIAIGLIAVAIRFIDINQPLIDRWSWRQSDVAAIARNYFENGFHFNYPQIDWAGDQPGYVGTEFPILPFVAALSYQALGVHEWIGRIQAVILFAASLPFFFLLVRRLLGESAATWALLFYSFAPLNIMASRCFMPDVPSLSFAIIGLYFFLRWTENDDRILLLAAAVAISLSILIKLPSAIIGAPLAWLAFDRRGLAVFRRASIWIAAAMALVPSLFWYWHAHRIAAKFYPHHFFGAGGLALMGASWYGRIARETFGSSLTPVLSLLAFLGLFATRSVRQARPFYVWLGAMLIFVVAVGYGNRHPWYQLPLVPIAAAFAGALCASVYMRLSNDRLARQALSLAVIVTFGLFSYACVKPLYRETAADLRTLGLELKRTVPAKSLVVAADYGDPTVFYYAERTGWHFLEKDGIYNGHPTSDADAIADLESLKSRGATHFVVYSGTFWWLDYYREFAQHLSTSTALMKATPEFKIYRLDSGSARPRD